MIKTVIRTNLESPFYLNMCGMIDDGYRKNYITPNICIGDMDSSYLNFNVVVNINYPYNGIPHRKMGRREEKTDNNSCHLYLVGMCDHDSENICEYVDMIIPKLRMKYNEDNNAKFLFHCYAGKSRSVAVALAFMVEVMEMSFDSAMLLIKEKRPIVEPRPLFIEMLRKHYNQ